MPKFNQKLEGIPLNTQDSSKRFKHVEMSDIEKTVEECGPMLDVINSHFQKYFPEQFKYFKKPDVQRYYRTYKTCLKHFYPDYELKKVEDYFVKDAFVAGVAVRYVDDFVDEALWPHLPKSDQAKLLETFRKFLNETFQAISIYVPDIHQEIQQPIELECLEMELTLSTDQKTFDDKATHLFDYKSRDLAYFYKKIFGEDIIKKDYARFQRSSVRDLLRDFTEKDYLNSTDFNVYNHIRKNNIDPTTFINYLQNTLKLQAPNSYQSYINGELKDTSKIENFSQSIKLEVERDTFVPKVINTLNLLKEFRGQQK